MSSEQPLDPQLIEQTKHQIRTLVNEIAQLSKSDVAPPEFYSGFLPRVVSALAAVGGAVWTMEDQGRLNLAYQMNFTETGLRESEENLAQHGRLLQKVVTGGEGTLIPPRSGSGENGDAANTTDFLLVMGPLRTELEVVGVVEIFQRPDAGPQTQKGYLRFLLQMCDLASDYLNTKQLRHFSDRQALWTQLEDFARAIHNSLDPRETAFTIANEARRLIECDRVSVAIRRGKKCRIEAVSGQDVVDKRSNTVQLLGKLATAVVAGEEPVWYTGDTSNMAPQIEDAVQEYVDDSHSKMVAVLPLARPHADEEDESDPNKKEPVPSPIGALIVEQIEDSRPAPKMIQRVQVVASHSSTALANALEHHNLFLMPVWKALGRATWVVRARTLPKTLLIAGAVVLVLLALVLVPWEFKLHCKGTVEPVERRDVFANVAGEVQSLNQKLVENDPDDFDSEKLKVQAGEPLVTLRNTSLAIEMEKVSGELLANAELIATVEQELLQTRQISVEDQARLAGQLSELQEKDLSLKAQQKLLVRQMEDLEVRSPITGQVVTWKTYNQLISRPVERGQVLMQLANTDGQWHLELQMPEDRMGFIGRARNQAKTQDPAADLVVEYVLMTDPGKTHYGRIKEIHPSAELHGEAGNTVLIKVAVDKSDFQPEQLRPGATVKAKVLCGRRAVGFVWFHDLIAWLQQVWFYLW